jgi:ParB family chromosome partitioning protein
MGLDATIALTEIVSALDTAIGQDGLLTLTPPLLSALREAQIVTRRIDTDKENQAMGGQAIPGPRKQIFMGDPEDVTIIGRDTKDGPEHPLYDPRAHDDPDEFMVANIRRAGVKKPILVCKVDDQIVVVDGRRRVINARRANVELDIDGEEQIRVPMFLEKGKEDDLFETMVLANCFTKQPSPIDNAKLLERFLQFSDKTEQDAAQIFGVTTRTIANWKELLKLDPAVQKAVDNHELSATAAAKLTKLEPDEQKEALKELKESKPNGKRATVASVAKTAGNATASHKAPPKRVIRKLLALDEDELYNAGLDDQFLKAMRWMLGDIPSEKVKGMKKLLRKVDNKPNAG